MSNRPCFRGKVMDWGSEAFTRSFCPSVKSVGYFNGYHIMFQTAVQTRWRPPGLTSLHILCLTLSTNVNSMWFRMVLKLPLYRSSTPSSSFWLSHIARYAPEPARSNLTHGCDPDVNKFCGMESKRKQLKIRALTVECSCFQVFCSDVFLVSISYTAYPVNFA